MAQILQFLLTVVLINQNWFDFSQLAKQCEPSELRAEGLLISMTPNGVANMEYAPESRK
jgi:hypothetical protein